MAMDWTACEPWSSAKSPWAKPGKSWFMFLMFSDKRLLDGVVLTIMFCDNLFASPFCEGLIPSASKCF